MAVDQTGIRIAELSETTTAYPTDSLILETAGGTKRIKTQNIIPVIDNSELTALQNRLKTNNAEFTLDYQGGQWGWNEKPTRGADTFHPFSQGIMSGDWKITVSVIGSNSYSNMSSGASGSTGLRYTIVFRLKDGEITLQSRTVSPTNAIVVPDGTTVSSNTRATYAVTNATMSIEPWS